MLQLIYASAATRNFSHAELIALLVKARPNNTTLGITGMMLYHAGSFIQVLEGEEGPVKTLFSAIGKDKRHTNVKIIFSDTIDEREFSDWSMGFFNTEDNNTLPDGFLNYASEVKARTINKTRAKKVLKMFQEGVWRQKVDR